MFKLKRKQGFKAFKGIINSIGRKISHFSSSSDKTNRLTGEAYPIV